MDSRVPFYQRPYVWNKDDQWGRLWEDIGDKAEARLQGGKVVPHFGRGGVGTAKEIGIVGRRASSHHQWAEGSA